MDVTWADAPGSPMQTGGWADSTSTGWGANDRFPQTNESKEEPAPVMSVKQDYTPGGSRSVQAQWAVPPVSPPHVQEDVTVMDVTDGHDISDARIDPDPLELEAPPPPTPTLEEQPSRRSTSPSGVGEGQRTLREDRQKSTHEEFIKYALHYS